MLIKNSISFEYIAGFFDGEGCIHIHKGSPKGTVHLEIIIVSGNKLILQNIQRFLNLGSVRPHGFLWGWRAVCQEAKQILINLYPFLQIKKEQAGIAIQFQNLTPRGTRFYKSLKEKKDHLEKLRKIINSFNSKNRRGRGFKWIKVTEEEAKRLEART